MEIKDLIEIYSRHSNIDLYNQYLMNDEKSIIHIKNLVGSARALFAYSANIKKKNTNLFVLTDKEEAAYFYNDLLKMDSKSVYFFPSSYKRSSKYHQVDNENIVLRTEVQKLLNKQKKYKKDLFIVTFPEALVEKVVSAEKLEKNTLNLNLGEELPPDFIREMLDEFRFEQVDFVIEPGQYSTRGSIIDIFSYAHDTPYRIDFFGDEVESIRSFNIENQLSIENFDQIEIIPNVQKYEADDERLNFLETLPPNTIVWAFNPGFIEGQITAIYNETTFNREEDTDIPEKHVILSTGDQFIENLASFPVVEFGYHFYYKTGNILEFKTTHQPTFKKDFGMLLQNLIENHQKGFRNFILSDSEKQVERLETIFADLGSSLEFEAVNSTVHEGFADEELKICVYTDHQIFDRYHKYKLPNKFNKKEILTLKQFNELHPGDYVVHIDHGIGKFGGLETIEVNGKKQETIRLVYRDNDVLYVNIHSLHKVSKYKGKDSIPPKIYKLGTSAWKNLKQKTKNKVKDIAKDLILLYAKRKQQTGFAFSGENYLQQELEASFFFEDTPDQVKSTQAVKQDMESLEPMDRLICGDVGFGKTEVAIRAAFKAVTDNKQVAVLVPTTILALQHYRTFSERLENFPCNVDYLSRNRKPKDQKEIRTNLENGKIDIIIGTHKLVGNQVKFKDLGLLVIDEEQKFGVSVKEKLRQLKLNVDTLTLTATPIPRTLQFSMLGARDLSIINTPPPNRYPIITELHTFNEEIIREAVHYEVQRNGQVFFINNRVQNIYEVEKLVNKLCPKVKTVVAHGQMEGPKLEGLMIDFINGDYDVLIATTIVESGLDIPNANTIIINNAHNFGLSDLHQLRGRVGRSNKKAFCYLLAPPLTSVTPEARRRLKAIEEFSELGSGFNIAMQDLDIRGAGNLLGGEQSGYISDIGYETYQRILDEAILELRENEFKEIYQPKTPEPTLKGTLPHEEKTYVSDCTIDTDLEILFPEHYIKSISERIRLYRELDNAKTEEELDEFEKKLDDRFGDIPKETLELLDVVRLRWLAVKLGFENIILKKEKMICHFVTNQTSDYYKSSMFMHVLQYMQKKPLLFTIKEGEKRLSMIVKNIKNIREGISIFATMLNDYETE